MANKSGRIGREGENGVAAYLRWRGAFPSAEPRALHGANDKADIVGVHPFVFQVKSGKAAENASLGQIQAWLADAETQRANAQADYAVLVIKRAGYSPKRAGHWRAFVALDTLADWTMNEHCHCGVLSEMHEEHYDYRVGAIPRSRLALQPVELEFSALVDLLQAARLCARIEDPFDYEK